MSDKGQEPFTYSQLANGWTIGRFAALNELGGIVHAVTTRRGFDVAGAATNPKLVTSAVRQALGVRGVAYCRQMHGQKIVFPQRPGPAGPGDGLITAQSSLALMGLAADCPLILAADPVSGAVGLAHASWRGIIGRIASELVTHFVSRYGTQPADLVACISPSAGPCCYEIGPDVLQLASAALGLRTPQFIQKRAGKMYFDLWAANVDELIQAGLESHNIHTAGVCTLCHNDLFPSYRLEGKQAGRFVAVIAPT